MRVKMLFGWRPEWVRRIMNQKLRPSVMLMDQRTFDMMKEEWGMKENCVIMKLVQEQLNRPDLEEVKIIPGTYEVYQTITVPPMKRLVGFRGEDGKYLVILNGHVIPVLDFQSPVHPKPLEDLSINIPADAASCSTKPEE
jgi:hypothetical protein